MYNKPITILHPSRNRSVKANQTIREWLSKAKDKSKIEYILSVDIDDIELPSYKRFAKENGVDILISKNKSAIEAINASAKVSTGNIIIVSSDDFSCPQDWDELLLKELEGKEDFIVKTQDGIQPYIITLPIMDRKYYNRFGYVYEHGYRHLWSDLEMTDVGHILGKVITSDLYFEHRHYSVKKSKKDKINVKNDSSWKQGERYYNKRKSINFGL